MTRHALPAWILAAAVSAAAMPVTAQSPDQPPGQGTQAQAVEPATLDLLRGAGAALSSAKSLSFTATDLHDVPSAEGQSVLYTVQSRVALRRPDRLRIDTAGDGAPSLFVSDGRTMTLFPDPARSFTAGLTRAFVVGESRLVGGVETEVVAFASPDAQGQIWIGAQDRLPRQLWVPETGAPGRPRGGVVFSDWRLDPPLDDRTFSAAGAGSTAPVPFTRLGL